MTTPWLALIESNTSGTGRLFARAARGQGFRPVLLASDPDRYAYILDDGLDAVHVDTQDESAVFEACGRLAAAAPLAGITSSSEYYIAAAAAIARRLGLAGPDPASIAACRNKHTQRMRLDAAGIGIPRFHAATSVEEAIVAARQVGFPAIVKPITGSGSVGVKLCAHADEVAAHADALLGQERNERGLPILRQILVEELVTGPEYSVETCGRTIIGITAKRLGAPPYFVEIGHDHPASVPRTEQESICRTVVQALQALGLGWGPAHSELRLTSAGPKIIEVNPRLGGDYIPELIRLAHGVDVIAAMIRLAAGREPDLRKTVAGQASIRFIVPTCDGTVMGAEGVDEARAIPGVVNVQIYPRLGDHVQRRGDYRDRVGHIITSGATSAAAHEAAAHAQDSVTIHVEPRVPAGAARQ